MTTHNTRAMLPPSHTLSTTRLADSLCILHTCRLQCRRLSGAVPPGEVGAMAHSLRCGIDADTAQRLPFDSGANEDVRVRRLRSVHANVRFPAYHGRQVHSAVLVPYAKPRSIRVHIGRTSPSTSM